jgi:hypothetical protein
MLGFHVIYGIVSVYVNHKASSSDLKEILHYIADLSTFWPLTLTIINCSGISAEIEENYDFTFLCSVNDKYFRLWRFQHKVELKQPKRSLNLLNSTLAGRKVTEGNFTITRTTFPL